MRLMHLFIRDFKNLILFVNGVFQMLILFYRCICNILKLQYYIYLNGRNVFIAIKTGIISNWHYCVIFSLIIIIRMYADKCNDIYEMYNYETHKTNNYDNMVMFDIYKLKHKIHQTHVNYELKIKLIMYERDTSLYKLYDRMLDKNYILAHKYNQLLINKHIEKYYNNLFKRKDNSIES